VVFAVFFLLLMVAKAGGAIFKIGANDQGSFFFNFQRVADLTISPTSAFVNAAAMRTFNTNGLRLFTFTYIGLVIAAVYLVN
jgi:hypothetical protein